MAMRLRLLRFLCLVALSVWVGGFTFYSAVVIPVLHESLGRLETGFVTQRVTNHLNAAGGVAVVLWWLVAWVDASPGPGPARRTPLASPGRDDMHPPRPRLASRTDGRAARFR